VSFQSVELVRQGYAAMSRFDTHAMEAICDPEIEFESSITAIDRASYRGLEGLRTFIGELRDAFEWIDFEALEIVGNGDRLVVTNRLSARGARSGADIEQRFFQALRFRSGKVIWWSTYNSKREALKAVGLED